MQEKHKFYLIFCLSIIFTLIIGKRFYWNSYKDYETSTSVESELNEINSLIGSVETNGISEGVINLSKLSQNSILDFIAKKSSQMNKLELEKINKVHVYEDESGVTIETYPFETKGNIHNQIVLIDSINKHFPASIRSIELFTNYKNAYEKKNSELHMLLYFQRSK